MINHMHAVIILVCVTGCGPASSLSKKPVLVQDGLHFMAVVPEKRCIITATLNGECIIWDEESFSEMAKIKLPPLATGFDVSTDGRLIIAGTERKTIIETQSWSQ